MDLAHVIVFLFFISLWIVDYWWTRQTRRGLPSAPKSPPQSANMARNADAAREERLKAMEIEALGTQRREILSTADAPNPFRRITTTQLELARAASQKGTEAQKLAEAHKTELTAWSEAWKTMGDETLEDLDDLMLGQTHRAQLTNAIQGTGGQEYNRAKGSLRGGPPRGGGGSRGRGVGRGGGAVGAHGHLTHARSLSLQARAANPRIIPEVPKIRKDPSLESSSKHTNEPPKRGKRPARPPTLRTRRVATPASRNYEALLADSSLFMAAVPAITASFNARPAQPQAAQPKVLVNDDEDRNTHPAVDPNVTENYDSVEEMSVDESTEQVRDEQHILESEDPEHPPEVQNPPRLRPLYVVFPIPSDNTGDTVADSDENKDINGFNTSVPQPLGRPRQSSLLIDLVADGDSVSKSDAPAFGNRGSHASVARPAPEKSLLDTTPEESKSLHPEKSPTLKSAKREPDVSCDATEFSNLLKEYGELEKIIAQSSSLAGPALEYLQLRQGQLRTQIAEKQAELLKSISNIRISEPKKEVVKASPQPETVQHVSRPVAQAHSQASVAKTVPPARLGGASDTKSLADKAHRPAPSTSGDVSAAVTSTYFPPPSHNIIGDHLLPGRYREPRQEAGTSTSSSEADEDESSRRLSPKTFFSSRKPSTDITRGSGHTRASQSVASIFDAPSRSVSSTAGTTAPPLVQERTTPSFPLTAATMQYSGASLNKTAGNAGSNRADSPPKQQAAKAAPKPPASSATIYGQKFSVPVHQPRTTSHVPMNAITRQYMGIGFDKNDTQSNEPTPTTTVPSRVNNVITRQYLGAVRSTNSGNQSNESTAASTTSPSHARRGSMNPQVSRHMSSPPKKPRHKRSPSKVSRSESFNSNNDTCNKGKSRAASGLQASKWAS
ncbi:hypothetical protein AJ80_03001 [Polytolypa hystricis UAMH7299]|uniref:Uncharacterized protein n=1 Tax=Polytolypa hystricis (strain UAMH7299) TaxID=1447883 RepID=A0A2B7YQ13_POLH7|nr:hypothetical protein AJ80_03001 [Polytolypa hystricis UAMH7299]